MIVGNINDIWVENYKKAHPRFEAAFEALKKLIADGAEVGKYEIDGKNIYAMVQEYDTKPVAEKKFEIHKDYIDIQYIIEGEEEIRFDVPENLKPGLPPKGDNIFFDIATDTCDTAVLSAGEFAVIFPGEPHAPGIRHSEDKKNIRKIVFKIKY